MKELTQTVTATAENGWLGNCWQTAVACLLDVDPNSMPAQADHEYRKLTGPDGKPAGWAKDGRKGYHDVLQAYLRTHHGLAYCELNTPPEVYSFLRLVEPGWHLMTGRTVRSDDYGGMRHVVVGRYGEVVWDPHPSRAGLLDEIRWAFLVPYPKWWHESDARQPEGPTPCVCPECFDSRVI